MSLLVAIVNEGIEDPTFAAGNIRAFYRPAVPTKDVVEEAIYLALKK